jgi:tetratricopeptide (TPR) repeat protein
MVRHFDCLYRLGLLRLQQGRFAEAEPLFRRAVKIDKRSADAHHHLAIALTGLARLEEATERYEKVRCRIKSYLRHERPVSQQLQRLPHGSLLR